MTPLLTKKLVSSLSSVVLLAAIAGASFAYYRYVIDPVPCSTAKAYSLGKFDTKFGISQVEFMEALETAADVWNAEAGKEVFRYDVSGQLTVSLVYDERQESVELRNLIDAEQSTYEEKAAEVDAARSALDAGRAAYDRLKDSIEARTQKGDRLTPEERESVNADIRKLNNLARDLNQEADEVNERIRELNALAAKTNAKVDVYNSSNTDADFDQGRYIRDRSGERITIYEFESKAELTRALIHEFGHALGIGHTESKASIMYPYNTTPGLTLTGEDKAAFDAVCEPEHGGLFPSL